MSQRNARTSRSPVSRGKRAKDLSPEQLSATLVEVEKSWQAEAKQRADEEKRRKQELAQAKKLIAKEVRTAEGMKRKKEMEVKRMEQKVVGVDKLKETVTQGKKNQIERIDVKINKCDSNRNDYEAGMALKQGELGEAKGRLAHARFAEMMLGKGMIVPIGDGAARDYQGQLMDNEEFLMVDGESMDMTPMDPYQNSLLTSENQHILGQLEIQNSRLVNENRELLTRLEAAETYLEEMEQKMLFAQGADVGGGASESSKVASLRSENFRLSREVQELRIIVESTGGAPNVVVRELSGQDYVGSVNIATQAITPRITSQSAINSGSLQMGQAIYQPAPQTFSYGSQVGAGPYQAAPSSVTVPQAYQTGVAVASSPYPDGGLAKGSLAYQMGSAPYQAGVSPSAAFRQPGTFTVPSSPYPQGTFTVPSLPSSSYQVPSYVAPASAGFPELQPLQAGQPLQLGSYSRAQSPTGYAPQLLPVPQVQTQQLLAVPQVQTGYAPQVSTPTRMASQPSVNFPLGTPLATMATPTITTAPFAMPLSSIKTAAPQFAPNVADFPIVVETAAPRAMLPATDSGGNNAARRGSATDMLFDMLDKNHDGVVSRQEFRAGLKGHIIAGGGTP